MTVSDSHPITYNSRTKCQVCIAASAKQVRVFLQHLQHLQAPSHHRRWACAAAAGCARPCCCCLPSWPWPRRRASLPPTRHPRRRARRSAGPTCTPGRRTFLTSSARCMVDCMSVWWLEGWGCNCTLSALARAGVPHGIQQTPTPEGAGVRAAGQECSQAGQADVQERHSQQQGETTGIHGMAGPGPAVGPAPLAECSAVSALWQRLVSNVWLM